MLPKGCLVPVVKGAADSFRKPGGAWGALQSRPVLIIHDLPPLLQIIHDLPPLTRELKVGELAAGRAAHRVVDIQHAVAEAAADLDSIPAPGTAEHVQFAHRLSLPNRAPAVRHPLDATI
jgi:hypothetical protein